MKKVRNIRWHTVLIHLNNLNSEKPESWFKNTQRKDKVHDKPCGQRRHTNRSTKIEKVTEFKYLGQTTHLKDTTKEEIDARIRAAWSCFGKKTRKYSRISNSPFHLKNKLWTNVSCQP